MKLSTLPSIILGLVLAFLAGCSPDDSKTTSSGLSVDNPFSQESDRPFGAPKFDEIRFEHFEPAIMAGMTEHKKEVQKIIDNPEDPTFENTIAAVERSGKLLDQATSVFYHLNGADTTEDLQALAQKIGPLLSKHYDEFSLNPKVFERIKFLHDRKDTLNLSKEQQKLLEDYYTSVVRTGALLDESSKEKLKAINSQISLLTTQFGQNLLAETNGFELILDEKDLDGLAEPTIQAGKTAAEERLAKAQGADKDKYKGKYVFTPHRSSMYPFLTESNRRDLRKEIYKSYTDRGDKNNEFDNKGIIKQIVELRATRAKLLGYPTHAHYVLEQRMLNTPTKVNALLQKLWKPALNRAKRELKLMQRISKREGNRFDLEASDWWQYSEKLRKQVYDLDDSAIRPYLKLDNVINGAFEVANQLWGLSFKERFDIPLYHPDARAWEVTDKDGSHIGVFIGDFFTRSSKRGGAWMQTIKPQSNFDGRQRPIVLNVCNFPPPIGDDPSLLTMEHVRTMFHEFGHGLHGLLTNVQYPSLSGTSGPRDYTEFPAQIYEHWATEPSILKKYATHYQTGEAIPDALIKKIAKSSKFNQGFANTEYLAASLLDMQWHLLTDGYEVKDVNAFENKVLKDNGLMDEIVSRYRSTYFAHIFAGGYSAGYYAYIQSAVLDSDGFAAFKETGNVFDPNLSAKLRKYVYESGGTDEAMNLYVSFRGREPKVDALLKVRGLDGKFD